MYFVIYNKNLEWIYVLFSFRMAASLYKWEMNIENIEVEFLKESEKIGSSGLPDIGARKSWTSWFWHLVQALKLWISQYYRYQSYPVGCAIWLKTSMSWVQPLPRSATFFRGDWSWNIFYGHSLPSADLRRAVVSFWRKNVHNTG